MSGAVPTSMGSLTLAQEVDSLCDRYEAALRRGEAGALDSWLPAGGPARRAALVELARLEFEHRLRAGEAVRAEDYFTRFPELAADAGAAARLRAAGQQVRPEPTTQGAGDSAPGSTQAQPALSATPPFLAPGYEILGELGRGGMGVVYKARQTKLKRLVALKMMLPSLAADAVARQRFLREAQAMAAVLHDHIVTIFQVDEDNGVPFLAMEFLQGMSLDKWLKDGGKPTVAQVLRLGREVAEGLAAAHERGLIHRDVKPGNIWLDSTHKGRVKILDFGLARAEQQDVHLTRSGTIVGTPAYMAPEQARGEKVDPRSDLFSLGCVLYRICTGALPFTGDSMMALLTALALDNPRPVRDLNPDVPAELSDLVMHLLAKDPGRRPQSAREVAESLQTLETRLAWKKEAEDAMTALPAAPTPPPAAPRRRRRLGLIVAGLVLLAGLIGAGAALIRIQTDQGDYVIETDAPDFFFQVHDGAVTLEDRKNNKTYTLKVVRQDKGTGEYELEVGDAGDLSFRTKTFTIKRGEKAALTAWFEPKNLVPAARADDKVALAGNWKGTWSNNLGETGDDTLILAEDEDGNLSGKWTGSVDVTGMQVNSNSFELKGKTSKRSYQINGAVKNGVMTLSYIVTRLNSDGTYKGKSEMTRAE